MFFKKIFFIAITLFSTSCSYLYDNSIIQNRDTDYLKAKPGKTLVVPAGLSSSTIDTHYPVSDISHPETSKKVKLLPPELTHSTLTVVPKSETVTTNGTSMALQQKIPNYYFDQYSRASSPNKAGVPIGEVLNKVWPWSKKTSVEAVNPPTLQTASSTTTSPPSSRSLTEKTGQPPAEKSKMPNMYYDRFSGHQ